MFILMCKCCNVYLKNFNILHIIHTNKHWKQRLFGLFQPIHIVHTEIYTKCHTAVKLIRDIHYVVLWLHVVDLHGHVACHGNGGSVDLAVVHSQDLCNHQGWLSFYYHAYMPTRWCEKEWINHLPTDYIFQLCGDGEQSQKIYSFTQKIISYTHYIMSIHLSIYCFHKPLP